MIGLTVIMMACCSNSLGSSVGTLSICRKDFSTLFSHSESDSLLISKRFQTFSTFVSFSHRSPIQEHNTVHRSSMAIN